MGLWLDYFAGVHQAAHFLAFDQPHVSVNSYWVDPARKDGRAYRERYWAPTVLIRGSIAVVWAPYEFWIDGKTSHCGIDVFDFVKVDGAWRVANSMWTVEPDACTELRPADASAIRPAGRSARLGSARGDAAADSLCGKRH